MVKIHLQAKIYCFQEKATEAMQRGKKKKEKGVRGQELKNEKINCFNSKLIYY
jgi:hypothetical protein